jgi:bifunctional DNase/RNase
MNKVEVWIESIAISKKEVGSYTIVLSEKPYNTGRKLPIFINSYDATFMLGKIKGIKQIRPSTKDLIKSITTAYSIDIQEIFIQDNYNGTFIVDLLTSDQTENIVIPTNMADALSLSLLYDCPIYISDFLLGKYPVEDDLDEDDDEDELPTKEPKEPKKITKKTSIQDLQKLLDKAIDAEDYLKAKKLKEKIDIMRKK